MINTPDNETLYSEEQIHPGLQFLVFTGIFVLVLILGNIIGLGVASALYGFKDVMDIAQLKTSSPNAINTLWILQVAGTTLPILAAPVFFAYIIVQDPADYLKPNIKFPYWLLFLGFFIMLIANPTIEILSNINQKLQLPEFLSGMQKWMEESEKNAQTITGVMLKMPTIGTMFFDLFLIGLVTAIVEELMFRGVLQTIFARWTQSYHAAVWITAVLFSAFHMEFFGFLPRVLLGALFGYFVVWSGSIWPAIWGHFVNNGSAVVASYLFQHKIIKTDPDNQHLFNYAGYILSFLILLALLFIFRKTATEQNKTAEG